MPFTVRSADSRWIDRRMALARRQDELVDQIRAVKGYEDFLRPPSVQTLLASTALGPVVVVNVSRSRCDALLVTTGGVRVLELPGLTAADVLDRAGHYLRVLRADSAGTRGLTFIQALHHRAEVRREREDVLADTLHWLWDTVAEPVLRELGFTAPTVPGEPWPRLWWCPTGLLTQFPLHAAGYHGAANGRTVLDRVVSSYTPTLRALNKAMKSAPDPAAGPARMLFVGVPESPGQLSLNQDVAREREILCERFPGRLTILESPDATVSAVRDAMATHRLVHLSCHGHQDPSVPSAAGLLMFDGTLTIAGISAARHGGDFAFLSACSTAAGGVNLPDEVLTLAAALNYSGYRHVIATLWSVDPAIAAEVSEAVYSRMTPGGVFAPDLGALALHEAVLALRADGRPLDDWLPFTHTGP